MLKVLLVDDHSVVREGMKLILQAGVDVIEVGEAADAFQAMVQVRDFHWDLVLLDIRLPGRSGAELLKQIKQEKPQLAVLILSTCPESQYAVRLIHAGAAGYLSKDSDKSEILKAVKLAVSGRRYISPVVAELLADHVDRNITDDGQGALHEVLSDREYQIFLELASGRGPAEIGEKLQLNAKTVSTHRARILRKMGYANNAEIILYASKHELI